MGRNRRTENGKNTVADKLDDGAAPALDDLRHLAEIVVQHGDKVLGFHALTHGGEAPQVTHQDGERPLFASQSQSFRRFQKLPDNLVGKVAPKGFTEQLVAQLQLTIQRLNALHSLHRVP